MMTVAIIKVDIFRHDRQLFKTLEDALYDIFDKTDGIKDILTDMKRLVGKRTIVYILKCLYHNDTKKLRADLARLNLMSTNIDSPAVNEFEVLSAIWPFILNLCTVDEEFFVLMRDVWENTELFYEDPRT